MALATPTLMVTFSAKDLDDLFTDQAFWQRLRKATEPTIRELFTELFLHGANLGRSVTPVENKDLLPLDPNEINEASQRVIDTYFDEWWGQFVTSTQNRMRGIFTQARIDGSTLEAIIDDLAPLFGRERAMRIAATETTRLFGLGAQATYARAGIEQWSWQTVNDPAVDPICRDLQDRRFPIATPFSPAHVNCRCFPRPVTGVPAGRRPPRERRPRRQAPEPEQVPAEQDFPATDFKTVPEIERFMRGRFPETFWSFTGLEPRVANAVARRLAQLSREWPGAQQRLHYVGTNRNVPAELKPYVARFRQNIYAHVAWNGRSLSINPKYFGKEAIIKASIRNDVEHGWHPRMRDPEDYISIITHEWGHVIDAWLSSATNRMLTAAIHTSGFGDVASTFAMWKQTLLAEARRYPELFARGEGRGVFLPSQYAFKNDAEAFAELYSASIHGAADILEQALVRYTRAVVARLREASMRPRVNDVRFTTDLRSESELLARIRRELAELAEEIGLGPFAAQVLGISAGP